MKKVNFWFYSLAYPPKIAKKHLEKVPHLKQYLSTHCKRNSAINKKQLTKNADKFLLYLLILLRNLGQKKYMYATANDICVNYNRHAEHHREGNPLPSAISVRRTPAFPRPAGKGWQTKSDGAGALPRHSEQSEESIQNSSFLTPNSYNLTPPTPEYHLNAHKQGLNPLFFNFNHFWWFYAICSLNTIYKRFEGWRNSQIIVGKDYLSLPILYPKGFLLIPIQRHIKRFSPQIMKKQGYGRHAIPLQFGGVSTC